MSAQHLNRAFKAALTTAAFLLMVSLMMPLAAGAEEIDPFYAQRLEDGIRLYRLGDHAGATEELRIAAFGLLARPERLAQALTHLALAQSSLGDDEGFADSYHRLLDLERRFAAYTAARLQVEVRAALDRSAASLPAALGPTRLPVAQVASAPTGAEGAVARPRLCISWDGDGSCAQAPITPETSPPSSSPSAEELAAVSRLDRLAMDNASTRKMCGGFEQARAIADRHPAWSEPQRIAGALASRCGSFEDAVELYDRAGGPIDERPDQLFYLSVALFETDRMDQAASVLKRALPSLEQNREVRKYVRRILDVESAG